MYKSWVLFVSLLPTILFFVTFTASIIYIIAVAMLVFIGVQMQRDLRCIVFLGSVHARVCCALSQRILFSVGAYDKLMRALAHRKIRRLPTKKITTCFFGDSTFALWPGLQESFERLGMSVVNLGFGGATSTNMRAVIPALLDRKSDFDLLVVHVGGNDFDISGHTRDVLANLLYIKNVAPCKVVFLHVPRKPGYSPRKWASLSQLAKKFPDVLDVSWVNGLEYHIDGNHATNHSCNKYLAPSIHRVLMSMRCNIQTNVV